MWPLCVKYHIKTPIEGSPITIPMIFNGSVFPYVAFVVVSAQFGEGSDPPPLFLIPPFRYPPLEKFPPGCLPSQGSQGKVREFTLPLEKSGKSQGI